MNNVGSCETPAKIEIMREHHAAVCCGPLREFRIGGSWISNR
jgi:hypothetical protein